MSPDHTTLRSNPRLERTGRDQLVTAGTRWAPAAQPRVVRRRRAGLVSAGMDNDILRGSCLCGRRPEARTHQTFTPRRTSSRGLPARTPSSGSTFLPHAASQRPSAAHVGHLFRTTHGVAAKSLCRRARWMIRRICGRRRASSGTPVRHGDAAAMSCLASPNPRSGG